MTETEKQTAAYFDSNRNCPIYTGDVYKGEGEMLPFHKVVKAEKGFMVEHVGTNESFTLTSEGPTLIKKEFIGNIFENPNLLEEQNTNSEGVSEAIQEDEVTHPINGESETENAAEVETVASKETELSRHPHAEADEETPAEPEEVGQDKTEETSETAEEAAPDETEPSTEPSETLDNAGQAEAEDNTEVEENITNSDENEQKAEENEQETANCEQNSENCEHPPVECEQKTSNVMVEAAPTKYGVPEVIANTKEEKQALLRVQQIKKCIEKNLDEIDEYKEKVEYHKNLASTLDYKPFMDLKELVSEALHENVDEECIKGIKDRTKDFESIINIQNLLKDHNRKAADFEYEISKNEDENTRLSEEMQEIEEKISHFQAQGKLFN